MTAKNNARTKARTKKNNKQIEKIIPLTSNIKLFSVISEEEAENLEKYKINIAVFRAHTLQVEALRFHMKEHIKINENHKLWMSKPTACMLVSFTIPVSALINAYNSSGDIVFSSYTKEDHTKFEAKIFEDLTNIRREAADEDDDGEDENNDDYDDDEDDDEYDDDYGDDDDEYDDDDDDVE